MRPKINHTRRSVELDTGRRTIDITIDPAGHLRRFADLAGSAITRAEDDDTATIGFKGHAAVFSRRSWIGSRAYGFWEEIEPGAFRDSILDADVRFLHNHNPDLVLARNKAGSLRLAEDAIGLAVDADMTPTSYARDLALSLDAKDVTQMSFGFRMVDYEWRILDDDSELLVHKRVELFDVSTVTYPAYVETDASLRSDLLAVARSAGLAAVDLDRLGERIASPDDEVIEALRSLATIDRTSDDDDSEALDEQQEADPADPHRDAAFADRRMALLSA